MVLIQNRQYCEHVQAVMMRQELFHNYTIRGPVRCTPTVRILFYRSYCRGRKGSCRSFFSSHIKVLKAKRGKFELPNRKGRESEKQFLQRTQQLARFLTGRHPLSFILIRHIAPFDPFYIRFPVRATSITGLSYRLQCLRL